MDKKSSKMKKLLEEKPEYFKLPKIGENIEGRIVEISSKEILIDLPGLGLGIARGFEIYEDARDQSLKPGDKVLATLLDYENEKGILELSLRRAAIEFAWEKVEERKRSGEIFTIKVRKANKGGLIAIVDGIQAFLPVSQLSALYYPRVESGENTEIVKKLNSLINKEMKVKIIDLDREENKLILSQKQALFEMNKDKVKKLKIGQKVKGKITGLTPFGAFMNFKKIEGMIYISEISWRRIDKPENVLKVGETVEAEIIEIDAGEVKLSLKRLKDNSLKKAIKKLKKGSQIEGVVKKATPFGFLVQLSDEIAGVIRFSEIPEEKMEKMQRDKKLKFQIAEIRVEDLRVELTLKE